MMEFQGWLMNSPKRPVSQKYFHVHDIMGSYKCVWVSTQLWWSRLWAWQHWWKKSYCNIWFHEIWPWHGPRGKLLQLLNQSFKTVMTDRHSRPVYARGYCSCLHLSVNRHVCVCVCEPRACLYNSSPVQARTTKLEQKRQNPWLKISTALELINSLPDVTRPVPKPRLTYHQRKGFCIILLRTIPMTLLINRNLKIVMAQNFCYRRNKVLSQPPITHFGDCNERHYLYASMT